MRTWLSAIALSLAMSVPAAAVDIRFGFFPWPSGADGVTVPISPPMNGPNATIVVQQTNTAGYSTVSECTYFNVLKITATQFEIQHKTCKDGTPVKTDTTITMGWFAIHQ
jgi:hypothetical protein